MKYLIPKTVFILGLLVVIFSLNLAGQAINLSKSDTIVCDTFPPPMNMDWLTFDNTIKLWWEVPVLSSDSNFSLQNLYAYVLIKDGVVYDSILFSGEDTTEYFDDLGMGYPTEHEYYVSALYDLNLCGNPGEFGESQLVGPVIGYGYGGFILPFTEDWNTGSFEPNLWTADEHWEIDGIHGNPYPGAKCTCYQYDSAYFQELTSYWLDCKDHPGTGTPYIVGDIVLDFDIRLDQNLYADTNHLDVYIRDSLGWYLVEQFTTDSGSYDWTNYPINITEWAKGKMVRIKFNAHGEASWNIHDWYIDNIHVYRKCNPPRDLHWVTYDELMAWTSPAKHHSIKTIQNKELQGFNVYYESSYLGFTTDTFYSTKSHYGPGSFYVTAIYEDCEPASNYIYGPADVEEINKEPELKIFPNPCHDQFTIEADEEILEIQVINSIGESILRQEGNAKKASVKTRAIQNGIYFIRIKFIDKICSRKVVICHK